MSTPSTSPLMPPPPAPEGGVPPPSAPAAPPQRRGLARGVLIGIAAVVVLVVVVLAALLTGVLPGLKPGSSSSRPPAPTTFDTALGSATNSVSSSGGSWTAFAAFGIDSPVALSIPTSLAQMLGLSCPVSGAPSHAPSAPAYSGNYSNGEETAWLFFLYQASTSTMDLVAVVGSSATSLGTITGASCFATFSAFAGASGTIDSPVATAAVAGEAAGMTSRVASATSVLFWISGLSVSAGGQTVSSPASWNIAYTTCSLATLAGSGSEYSVSVNATSGAILDNYGYRNLACSSFSIPTPPTTVPKSIPLGAAFTMGSPSLMSLSSTGSAVGCATPSGSATEYCYVVPIAAAGSGLNLTNLGLEVKTTTGSVFPVARLSISAVGSTSVLSSLPATCTGPVCNGGAGTTPWTYGSTGAAVGSGPTTPVSTLMTIVIDMGTTDPTGFGYQLVALGQGQYTGSVAANLP